MADYWVSQARKFCDFCKCWIADNKPSIQSHENGKRHKEAVAQRISQMTKQSVKEKNESLKIDEEMKKMEEAAMKAYLKDVESNPDYTSQVIKETVSEARKMKETKKDEEPPIVTPPEITTKKHTKENVSNKKVEETNEKETEWYEAQSDEGYTYYWNYNTGESIWEAPPEGYVSIEEQTKASKEVENEGTNKITSESVKKKEPSEKEQPKINKRKIEEKEEDLAPLDVGMGPSCKPDPYGKWKTVETRIQEPIDYQLPQQDFVEIKVPTITEPEIKFKEKKITSIDDAAGPTTFKKRKFGARGNARQRFDDD